MQIISEIQQIKNYAHTLKMTTLYEGIDSMLADATLQKWSPERLVCQLLKKEVNNRMEIRKLRRVKSASFPQKLYLDDLVRSELPEDGQVALPILETLEFIKKGRNVVLYGNPGTGKTHIATGLGILACEQGYSVLFTSVPQLLIQLRECQSNKVLHSLSKKFENYDLVICDEFGYVSCDKEGGEMLFNHLSLRAGKKATIITTNLAFNRWSEVIEDKILVTALVDRLTHRAHLINMTGTSYRLKETQNLLK